MNQLIELLKKQSLEAFNWTNKLTENTSDEKWYSIPEVIETSLAWQIGHLTLSQYYYTVVLLHGPNKELAEKFNQKKYAEFFANGSKKKEIAGQVTIKEIKENWNLLQTSAIESINQLEDKNLQEEIFQLPKPHPFVKTKENALSWNIKHTMWHCGQIGTLKRIIDKPLNFGM